MVGKRKERKNMSKILIPENNTQNGTIINPQSGNTYLDILSFKDEDTKTKYIGKYLFNDINFNYINYSRFYK